MSPSGAILAEVNKYLAMLKADPNSQAFAPLADLYRKTGRVQEALNLCRQGVAKHPEFSGAQVLLAQLLIDSNQPKEAEQELLKLLRRLPGHLMAHQVLLQLYAKNGAHPQATAIAQRILKIKADDQAAISWLRGKAPAPTPIIAKASAPQPPVPTVTMAKLYEEQGHLEKALEIYALLAKEQPALAAETTRVETLITNKKKVGALNQLLQQVKQRAANGARSA